MPQTKPLFSFEPEVTQQPQATSQQAQQPQPTNVDTRQQLADIQASLNAITANSAATPAQQQQARKLAIDFDPSGFKETDPIVVSELKTNLVDKLNQQLGELDLGSSLDPKLNELDAKLNTLTEGLMQITERDKQREMAQSKQALQQAILNEVPDLPELMKDSSFKEFINGPIEEGSSLTVGNILRAAETNGDVGTIAAYVRKFKSTNDVSGGLPVTPPTQAQGATSGQGRTTINDISSLRARLRSGASRQEIAAQLKNVDIFKGA